MNTLRGIRWTAPRVLAALEAAGAALSLVSLIVMLAATPPFECGNDYESPTPPLHVDSIALWCLAAAVIGMFVAIGMAIGSPAASIRRRSSLQALGLSVVALLPAAGAVFADVARWTCWP